MHISPATASDLPAIAALVNSAYRGDSSRQGWTTEADYLGGQRTDAQALGHDLATKPESVLLTLRDEAGGPLLACAWLEPANEGAWYLGMLTVRPDLQDRKLGRTMLETAEAHACSLGARRIIMTVVQIRDTLIAWYERRGYAPTGETRPFPYDDQRFGEPMRDDLAFIVLAKTI